jgi:foldase protein PrsA
MLLALGAFFVLAVGIAACGSGVPGDSVASMDGNPITTQAFNHWMYVAAQGNASQTPGAPVIVPTDPPTFTECVAQVRKQIPSLAKTPDKTIEADCKQLFTSLSSQVMDFLIKAYWYQALAHKLGINVTQAQIQKAFDTAKKQQFPTSAQFQNFLKQTGQTMQDILYRVKVNQIYMRLIKRNTGTVTADKIAAYFNAHQSQFGTPETRTIRIVRTNTEAAAKAAKAALSAGQSWDVVTKKYSVDTATKNSGGLLTNVTSGEEEQALNQAAFGAKTHVLVGPVHGTYGWYVVEVQKITPATHQPLAKATPLIKQLLTSQLQTNAQTKVDNLAKKAFGAATLCRSGYSMADCHGYKAPKAATTPTVTPTTSTSTPTVTTTTPTTTTKK